MSNAQRFDPADPVLQPAHTRTLAVAHQCRRTLHIQIVPKVEQGG